MHLYHLLGRKSLKKSLDPFLDYTNFFFAFGFDKKLVIQLSDPVFVNEIVGLSISECFFYDLLKLIKFFHDFKQNRFTGLDCT